MPQSNFIFAALFFAFLVYIISKGEGPTYLALLSGGGNAAASPSPSTSSDALNIDVSGSASSGGGAGGVSSILGGSSGVRSSLGSGLDGTPVGSQVLE